MINSIGDISLFISFILAGFSLFVFTCSYINRSDILVDVGQRFLLSSFFSLTVSIVCLFVLYVYFFRVWFLFTTINILYVASVLGFWYSFFVWYCQFSLFTIFNISFWFFTLITLLIGPTAHINIIIVNINYIVKSIGKTAVGYIIIILYYII